MSLELRDYQQDLYARTNAAFDHGGQAVMMQLCTGGGKTGIAAKWTRQFNGRILFIVHTTSVINQAPAEFAKWGVNALVARNKKQWASAMRDGLFGSNLIAATVPKAANEIKAPRDMRDFAAVIVDEAHHAPDGKTQAAKLVTYARKHKIPVLGMTATPWRLSRKMGFSETWSDLVLGAEWGDLRGKYLAEVDLINPLQGIRGAGAASGKDFAEGATYSANYRNPIFTGGALDYYVRYGQLPDGSFVKAIIYSVGQKHAVRLAKGLAAREIPAGILISDRDNLRGVPKVIETDRALVNERLHEGDIRVVVNVNIVSEGYDLPDCGLVMNLRPTMSVALWKQIMGRGSRLTPDKQRLTLIDLTDNTERLGGPFRRYNWSLFPRGDEDEAGDAVMRRCAPLDAPSCDHWLHTSVQECPKCGESQGTACEVCGKFRLWQDHDDSGVCVLCREAESISLRPQLWDLGVWSNPIYTVTKLNLRKTRRGTMYVACKLRDGRSVNCFNLRNVARLRSLLSQRNSLDRWQEIEGYKVTVLLKEDRGWQNVDEVTIKRGDAAHDPLPKSGLQKRAEQHFARQRHLLLDR